VLDTFAAWSAVLEMGTPRVENRRDRHFTSLVHAALKASDASDAAARTCNLARSTSVHIEGWEVTEVEPGEELLPLNDADPRWPPIRLAVVGEAAPVAPSGLPRGSAGAADPLESLCGLGSDEPPLVEPPILIVEGETLAGEPSRADSPPPAQVRRHDYRHLFSRLRSG
jgi:hypothetical protein